MSDAASGTSQDRRQLRREDQPAQHRVGRQAQPDVDALAVAKPLFDHYDLPGHYRRGGELCRASHERLHAAHGPVARALAAAVEIVAATTVREWAELADARAFAEAAETQAVAAGRDGSTGRAQRRLGDELSRATALNDLGYIADARGDAEEAARRSERNLAVYERLSFPRGVASVKSNLLELYGALGRLDEAEAMGHASLARKESVGDVLGQIVTLKDLSDLQVCRGAPEAADGVYLRALRIARDADAVPRLLQVLVAYAGALDGSGRRELADAAIAAVLCHPTAPSRVRERARSLRPLADQEPAADPGRLASVVERWLLLA